MRIPFSLFFIVLMLLLPAAAIADFSASDPTGDNCTNIGCGPDITNISYHFDVDGTLYFDATRVGTTCVSMYPTVTTNIAFQFLTSDATDASQTDKHTGLVYTWGDTNQYLWSPPGSTGSDDETNLISVVNGNTVEVTVPAALLAELGSLPLKFYARNSCKDSPFEPDMWRSKDIAPDSGVYTLSLDPVDMCPNIAGDQNTVPMGMFINGSGNCVQDQCPNIAGGQETVPVGYAKDTSGNCLKQTITGTSGNNTLIGNILANLIKGLGGNDTLYGRAGNDRLYGGYGNDKAYGEAGSDKLYGEANADILNGGANADIIYGGPGPDTLIGGKGKDKLYGQDGKDILYGNDSASGDVLNGGAGYDTCYYNRGDTLYSCEKKIKK